MGGDDGIIYNTSTMEVIIATLTNLLSAKTIKSFFSALLLTISYLTWGFDQVAIAFFILLIIDFIFGISVAWKNHCISQKRMVKWLWKFFVYFWAIIVWNLTDIIVFHQTVEYGIKNFVIVYLWLTEALSILKHISEFGVQLPIKLIARIEGIRNNLEIKW